MERRTGSIDRRGFLWGGASAAALLLAGRARGAVRLSPAIPAGGDGTPRTLVVLQLAGGNDGLSTVVPWADDAYGRARSRTRIAAEDVVRLDDYRGLHPELAPLRKAWDRGELAIVEGVGYPEPNRSHFRSFEIWHAADPRGRAVGEGWIGRLAGAAFGDEVDPHRLVHVGTDVPFSMHSATHPTVCFATAHGYRWIANAGEIEPFAERGGSGREDALGFVRSVLEDARASSEQVRDAIRAHRPRVPYPRHDLAEQLFAVAALVQAGLGSRVLSVELAGFDTHTDQREKHDALMRQLAESVAAFLADLRGTEAGRNTVVMAFSEFGRRVSENASRGTDHGCAAPMLLLGQPVRGGLNGEHPSLTELDEGDLVHTTDFRSVYATVVERWFRVGSEAVLGERFPTLPLFA